MDGVSEMTSIGVFRQGCLQHEGRGFDAFRLWLESAQQSQYDHYDQYKADNSGRSISPSSAMAPCRYDADQHKNEDYDQDGP